MLDMLLFGFVMLFGFMVAMFIIGILLVNSLMEKLGRLYWRLRENRRDDFYINL